MRCRRLATDVISINVTFQKREPIRCPALVFRDSCPVSSVALELTIPRRSCRVQRRTERADHFLVHRLREYQHVPVCPRAEA